jgi:formimidoylglutamate deiminase
MHVAEQPAEVSACIEEYGRSPVALFETEGLLHENFTAVHAIHVTPKAIDALARSGATVCACPTTERNLGDGVVPVDNTSTRGVASRWVATAKLKSICSKMHAQLEYHIRLQRKERNVLTPLDDHNVRIGWTIV